MEKKFWEDAMLEYELKCLLNITQYHECLQILQSYEFKKAFIQTNYYYDTKNLDLHKNDITLRIRQIESLYRLQIKIPQNDTDLINVSKEVEREIYEVPLQLELKEYGLVGELPDVKSNIFMLGALKTFRQSFITCGSQLKIDVDKNMFLGNIDYEVEIEYTRENFVNALDLYKRILPDQNVRAPKKGKRERFIRRLCENGW